MTSSSIGVLQETSLHAALKTWYARPGDRLEGIVDGLVIDIIHGNQLIEIQTGNFGALRDKLERLLDQHPIKVVFPIAYEKWIIRLPSMGVELLTRRKSPKRGRVDQLFMELVRIPSYTRHENFSLDVVLTREEVVWRNDKKGSWRRKGWSIVDRKLSAVIAIYEFLKPEDYRTFLPSGLSQPFTVMELANVIGRPYHLAGKMVYCFKHMGLVEITGKKGKAFLYKEIH